MCGRYARRSDPAKVCDVFELDETPLLTPRYNVAPTQAVAAVRQRDDGKRECVLLRWGLVPSWSSDPKIGSRLINARAETVTEKGSFRTAFRKRRCLIVADGFYEWHQLGAGKKQPYYFGLSDGGCFGFAGLWEHWQSPEGAILETCTILTTSANALLRPVHQRMPVILPRADHRRWLGLSVTQPDDVLPLLRPFPAEEMT